MSTYSQKSRRMAKCKGGKHTRFKHSRVDIFLIIIASIRGHVAAHHWFDGVSRDPGNPPEMCAQWPMKNGAMQSRIKRKGGPIPGRPEAGRSRPRLGISQRCHSFRKSKLWKRLRQVHECSCIGAEGG